MIIDKIRYRVVTAAMIAFLTVIILISGLVNIVNYIVVTNRIDRTIDLILDYRPDPPREPAPDRPFRALPDEEANYMTRFFTVIVDNEENILYEDLEHIASVTEEKAADYASEALDKRFDRGYIQDYRYIRTTKDEVTVIVFLNCSRELQSIRTLLVLTAVISVSSIILVFLLSLFLSSKAIRPLEQNINIQRQFITDASHELKTPLTSMTTSLDVLEMQNGKDEWTDNIRRQIGRMSLLVKDLVVLSRLDEVKVVKDKESFDLSGISWEMLELYMPQAKAVGKDIEADIEDNVIMAGDKDSVKRLLSVLLDNAVKYSVAKSRIRFVLAKHHGKIKIEVINRCDYAASPDTERLFDRFYRPDSSRASDTGGSGIGLAIAKAVVQSHGGTITACCPDGKVMTITVLI